MRKDAEQINKKKRETKRTNAFQKRFDALVYAVDEEHSIKPMIIVKSGSIFNRSYKYLCPYDKIELIAERNGYDGIYHCTKCKYEHPFRIPSLSDALAIFHDPI